MDRNVEALEQMQVFIDGVDERLRSSFENMHVGYPMQTFERFLKAREGNVAKANKMLLDCLNWRVNNNIDKILSRPILPKERFDAIRESQLIGFSGFCKQGRPVFVYGVGPGGFDKAPVCILFLIMQVDKYIKSHIQINEYRDRVLLPEASKRVGHYVGSCLKILDMTGLKLSSLNRLKILTAIATVDDLNYPEKTDAYYIVNAPYVFTACWKAVKPLLHERTKRKVQVLQGTGKHDLLKVIDISSIPEFSQLPLNEPGRQKEALLDFKKNYFSPSHPFHVKLWNYVQNQASIARPPGLLPQPSICVTIPEPDDKSTEVVHLIESTLEQLAAAEKSDDLLNGRVAETNGN
ncbi:hypothetical protein O6H91_08G055000 [Diphasiastrum complanatum]|uniref:Uncharacterized protein n=1 Tax=Diphasiastrum complanatum TaxID=34168 RepID=A0ACC2CXN0_DIPCM|nr:hypothetical protein O6H91_08G055000 [Diphasiastrum complanatum]